MRTTQIKLSNVNFSNKIKNSNTMVYSNMINYSNAPLKFRYTSIYNKNLKHRYYLQIKIIKISHCTDWT